VRTFVVGDIHGQAELLRALMPRLRERAADGDALVFLGDYIDRGPASSAVVDQVLDWIGGGWPGPVTPLRGNHEEMLLDFLSPDPRYDPEVWIRNGAFETIASYTVDPRPAALETKLPAEHLRFFRELKSWHEDAHGFYVHAGFRPGRHPVDLDDDDLLWIREPFIDSDYAWEKVVVFGHTPQYEAPRGRTPTPDNVTWRPLNRPEKIGIDTGAAYGGPLTAVVLPEREFVSTS
jgi:serine/threonine protein phosphatase 1